MKKIASIITLLIFTLQVNTQQIIGVHLIDYTNDEALIRLADDLEGLKKMGVNTLFLEVDYNFDFVSHPELVQNDNPITKAGATRFTKLCASYGIKIVPQFQSLGHQSWAKNTWKLLTVYPELDLTPGAFPGNDSIYCREWDVMNPKVNQIVFPLIDEIIAAFGADGIHLGMDEVFLLGNAKSPSTKGMDPAFLYGKVVREFHDYFSKKQNKQLYIWGDRLINGQQFGYGSWEASLNGTWKAIDSIPKDIIICDWHYRTQKEYKSVDLFIEKGFKVIPCSWKDSEAASALIRYSYAKQNPSMAGHLFTLWGAIKKDELLSYPSMVNGMDLIGNQKFHEVFISQNGYSTKGELLIVLKTSNPSVETRYTLDGSVPNANSQLYKNPLIYSKGQIIKAAPFKNAELSGIISEAEFVIHKAIGKKVTLITEASDKYAAELQEKLLVNGVEYTASFSDGQWLGFEGKDCEFVIDLDSVQKLSSISINFSNKVNDWIHHPNELIVLGSKDGVKYSEIGKQTKIKTGSPNVNFTIPINGKVRFVKISAKNQLIPEGFNGAGNPAWIFLDEVVID